MIDLIRNESMLTKGGAKVAMIATLADLRTMRVRTDRDWADEDQQTINLMKEECELLSREFENGIIRNRPILVKEVNFEHDFDDYLRKSLLQVTNRVRLTLCELVFDLNNHIPQHVPDPKNERLRLATQRDTASPPYNDHDFDVIRGLDSRIYWLINKGPVSKEWAWEAMVDTISELRLMTNKLPRWGEMYKQEIADVNTELMRLSSLFEKGHVLIYPNLVKESDCQYQDFAFQLKDAVINTLEEFLLKLTSIISRGVFMGAVGVD